VFRWLARTALRWYYRDVSVLGAESVPPEGPVLVAVNHPNALVDALVAVCAVPRRLRITAKATLFDNVALAAALRGLGIVPLRRAADEASGGGRRVAGGSSTESTRGTEHPGQIEGATRDLSPATRLVDPERNSAAFDTLVDALGGGAAVLIFPEGISHSGSELAPLKSGLARIALSAVAGGAGRVTLVPLGLTFERKDAPRSRVLAQFGQPIVLTTGAGLAAEGPGAVMAEVDRRLRDVTLNFTSDDAAAGARRVARALALAGRQDDRTLTDADPPLAWEVALARRVQAAAGLLDSSDGALRHRAALFVAQLDAWRSAMAASAITAEDLWVDVGVRPAVRFVLRESLIAVALGPFALWGQVNHWAPLRLARWIGLRTSHHPDDPAMRTIAAGFGLVVAFYCCQTVLVAMLAGPWWALAYLLSLPVSATWDFRFRDRCRRVVDRARTYLALRHNPGLRSSLRADATRLWEEALLLEQCEAAARE